MAVSRSRSSSLSRAVIVFGFCLHSSMACAALNDWRWGFSFGFGGVGVSNTQALTDGTTGTVSRSEGPVVVSLFVDTLVSDNFGFMLEHSRGVNFLPFSTGVSFTGFVGRYYFLGPAPSMVAAPEGGSSLLIQRFVPYVGGAAGLAQANVQRDSTDLAPLVSGSGVYFGFRAGADYAQGPGRGLRGELAYSTTAFSKMFSTTSSTSEPAQLDEFALRCSWYFNF